MSKLFGTDGVRGIANQHPMTCEVALALGKALGHKYCKQYRKVVIGKDTRVSSYMFEMAIASGVCSSGCDALLVGPLPTPAVAFLTKHMRADAGIVISASHNSYEYNGIKIFGKDGFKLSRQEEEDLEKLIRQKIVTLPIKDKVGKMFKIDDARGRYNAFLKSIFPSDLDLVGLRIAIDCANGAAYRVAPTVLAELGAEVFSTGNEPDGKNINFECGATDVKKLQDLVKEKKCNVGIALDGDADRVIMVDEESNVVDGDEILSVIAEDIIRKKLSDTLVITTMSNFGLDKFIYSLGGKTVRTDVGDLNVIEEMRKNKYIVGGEQSGHIILSEHSTTGDGMVAALKILSLIVQNKNKLSHLIKMKKSPQCLKSIEVNEKIWTGKMTEAVKTVESMLGKDGRVLVRFSGTEPKLRVLVESPDGRLAEKFVDYILKNI